MHTIHARKREAKQVNNLPLDRAFLRLGRIGACPPCPPFDTIRFRSTTYCGGHAFFISPPCPPCPPCHPIRFCTLSTQAGRGKGFTNAGLGITDENAPCHWRRPAGGGGERKVCNP